MGGDLEERLRALYAAFNDRDVERVITSLHPEVDWPNAWEGGRIVGRDRVLEYWRRQFEEISSEVAPESFFEESDGTIVVGVHQVIHDARSGELLSDSRLRHRYRIENGLIARMEVLE